MASPLDIIEIPGYPGLFTRRIVVEMWQRAGSPPINDAGRLYQQQLDARLKYEAGTGSPADDPRRPDKYPLAHVRFGALDVANWARQAMIDAGFEYPYDYEPWHGQLPNIYSYPLVTSVPASAYSGFTPFPDIPQEDDMAYPILLNDRHLFMLAPGYIKHFANGGDATLSRNIIAANDAWIGLDTQQFLGQLDSFGIPRELVDAANGYVYDVREKKMVAGGMWSWARHSYQNTKTILDSLKAVEPPKA